MTRYVKDAVTNAPAANNIPVIQIESKTAQINDLIEYDLKQRLAENFGVDVSGIDLGAIEIDKTSDSFRQLMAVTRDVATATVQAQAEARVKDIHDKQRIEAKNYEEALRIQREEGQYALHKQTQSANLGAFQIEKQAEVGVAGAEALGKMGANGAGDVSLGGSEGGVGFNPAAMMAGMALGGAIGQSMAGMVGNMMSGVNQPAQPPVTPPPIPNIVYHVAVNGKATGPFDLAALKAMAAAGQISGDSLVWKAGMAAWAAANTIDELKSVFSAIPPIPPTE